MVRIEVHSVRIAFYLRITERSAAWPEGSEAMSAGGGMASRLLSAEWVALWRSARDTRCPSPTESELRHLKRQGDLHQAASGEKS